MQNSTIKIASTPPTSHLFMQPLNFSRENFPLMEFQSSKHMRRHLLPFFLDALSWLTGTATIKDVNSIKTRINQLITTQHNQQETLVHIISILNVTRYATLVNRQHVNILMDTMEKMHPDGMTLYNFMHSLYSSLRYQQIILHTQSILANLWDSLHYMREVAIHTMDYIDTETTGILSLHVLPVKDLWEMLKCFLPPCTYQFHLTMHYISIDIYVSTS